MEQIRKKKGKKKSLGTILKIAKSSLCLFLVSITLLSFSISSNASVCPNFTGREDAESKSQFKNEYAQNVFKVWSVLKSLGMTDVQACSFLGVMYAEGNVTSYTVEGDYACAKHYGMKRSEKFAEWFTDNSKTYVDYMIDHHYHGKGINKNAYYYKGNGACGIGICQWTGGRTWNLINYAKDHSVKWYTMETQLTYLLDKTTNDKKWALTIHKFVESHKNKSIKDCVNYLVSEFEGCPNATKAKKTRVRFANQFYVKLHNKPWDSVYGNKIISGAGLKPVSSSDGIKDVVMTKDNLSPAMYFPKNKGFIISTDSANLSVLNKNNQDVYKGYLNRLNGKTDTSKQYSLFELYGENLTWCRYLGESQATPALQDHIYSAWKQNRIDDVKNIQTLSYTANNYLSTVVYSGRPRCLTTLEVNKGGRKDPRASSELLSRFTGAEYILGSLFLNISKFFVSIISFLADDTIFILIVNKFTEIETDPNGIFVKLKPAINLLLAFGMIALIFSLVKKGILYARGIGSSRQDILSRFLISFLAVGVILASINNPAVFNKTLLSVTSALDSVFKSALAQGLQDNEVICVTDSNLAVRATLWEKGIFNPWCRGQFGKPYSELYTQFAILSDEDIKKGKAKYAQSHTLKSQAEEANITEAYYDSASCTGDIAVPVGGGKEIKNWAALMYSCGTDYHIDCDTSYNKTLKIDKDATWPVAITTAKNSLLYADTFRIIDAQMNISPQYFVNSQPILSYTDSKPLTNHFLKEGFVMLCNTMLLFFLIPALYSKIKNFIMLIITVLQIIYFSFVELFQENTAIPSIIENFKKYFFGYFIACLKVYLIVVLYSMFADKGFVAALIFAFLSITILSLTVQDVSRFFRRVKYNANAVRTYFRGTKKIKKT